MIALVFIPLLFILYRAFIGINMLDWNALRTYFNETKMWLQNILSHLPFIQEHLAPIFNQISFSSISGSLLKITSIIGGNSMHFIIDGCFIIIFLFVFFCWGENFYSHLKKLLPFHETQINEVAKEVSGTLRIVFFSTFFNVVLQGAAFGIASYILHFDGILLGIIYGICSMIPIVGGALIWIPVCIILFFQDRIQEAIILALYSAGFIGFIIDNILKPWLIGIINRRILSTPLQINELAIFFAILAGLSTFGFWGIIIGPAITALFVAILRVYESDFLRKDFK